MPMDQNLHQKVTFFFGCIGFSMYSYGFSLPQMRQSYLQTRQNQNELHLIRWKSASSVSRLQAHLAKRVHNHIRSTYIHTYIHNWPLQHFSQDFGLASHTTHVVCVNFISEWRDLQFNVDSERHFLRNFFMAGLFTLRVFARNLLRGSRRRNIFHISFLMTDLGYEPMLLRLISRHTTY